MDALSLTSASTARLRRPPSESCTPLRPLLPAVFTCSCPLKVGAAAAACYTWIVTTCLVGHSLYWIASVHWPAVVNPNGLLLPLNYTSGLSRLISGREHRAELIVRQVTAKHAIAMVWNVLGFMCALMLATALYLERGTWLLPWLSWSSAQCVVALVNTVFDLLVLVFRVQVLAPTNAVVLLGYLAVPVSIYLTLVVASYYDQVMTRRDDKEKVMKSNQSKIKDSTTNNLKTQALYRAKISRHVSSDGIDYGSGVGIERSITELDLKRATLVPLPDLVKWL